MLLPLKVHIRLIVHIRHAVVHTYILILISIAFLSFLSVELHCKLGKRKYGLPFSVTHSGKQTAKLHVKIID